MGNQIRTPKVIYKNGFVMEFYVKNKEIYYKIRKWDKSATNQALLFVGKLNGFNPNIILQSAMRETTQQKFTNVKEIEN